MINFNSLKNNIFIMLGPNVIESEEHVLYMAKEIKKIMEQFNITYVFKTSFDKANRTSFNSYRGVGIEEGIRILKKVKEKYNIPIITDIHEPNQAKLIAEVADIIQVPAFLCRQTDLLKAVAKTNKIIHVKKGQFCTAETMLKCAEKIVQFGNNKIILCERGTMFGYHDLIVDPRNLILLKGQNNLVSMDITHCLQQPSKKNKDGSVCAGGQREFIPLMARIATICDVNGIFMEVHNNPDKSKCDAPTQFPLDKLEELIKDILHIRYNINPITINLKPKNKIVACIPARYNSTRLPGKPLLKINNKTIINHVYDKVKMSKYIDKIYILTDDINIKKEVESFSNNSICIYKKIECLNGTERICYALPNIDDKYNIIVNVQGDEPFIDPNNIDKCIENFINKNVVCSTLHHKININESKKTSIGKLILDKYNNILYCSRNPIPVTKKGKISNDIQYYGHIGLFVYDRQYLENEYLLNNSPCQLTEDIEWLKILEAGHKINSVLVKESERSVDTIEDYNYLIKKYSPINKII